MKYLNNRLPWNITNRTPTEHVQLAGMRLKWCEVTSDWCWLLEHQARYTYFQKQTKHACCSRPSQIKKPHVLQNFVAISTKNKIQGTVTKMIIGTINLKIMKRAVIKIWHNDYVTAGLRLQNDVWCIYNLCMQLSIIVLLTYMMICTSMLY